MEAPGNLSQFAKVCDPTKNWTQVSNLSPVLHPLEDPSNYTSTIIASFKKQNEYLSSTVTLEYWNALTREVLFLFIWKQLPFLQV